jgi:PAS domain-containing protein
MALKGHHEAEEYAIKEYDNLEKPVQEQTAESAEANREVAQRIEKRKGAEKDFQLERHTLESILEAINEGVYIANRDYDIEYINPAIEKEFGPVNGRKRYEYLGGRKDICPWCKNPGVYAEEEVVWEWSSSRTGKTYEIFDTPILTSGGTVSKLEVRRDITERKRAGNLLRESEERYRNLVETMNDGFGIADEKGL